MTSQQFKDKWLNDVEQCQTDEDCKSAQRDFDAAIAQASHEGWCACLDSVRASLRMYPHGGGDTEIMQEVERIAHLYKVGGAMR